MHEIDISMHEMNSLSKYISCMKIPYMFMNENTMHESYGEVNLPRKNIANYS